MYPHFKAKIRDVNGDNYIQIFAKKVFISYKSGEKGKWLHTKYFRSKYKQTILFFSKIQN